MTILIAYYSLEGNCRELASLMAEASGADTAELRLADAVPTGVLKKYLVGGTSSILKESPALGPLAVNPGGYGLVVVGGPVWAWNIAPALRTFIGSVDWRGRKAAAFVMHRGGKGMALSSIKKMIAERGGEVAATADFVDLRHGNPEKTRQDAIAWIRTTAAALNSTP